MNLLTDIYNLFLGPTIHGKFTHDTYEMNVIESVGYTFVKTLRIIRYCAVAFWPVTLYWAYRRIHSFKDLEVFYYQLLLTCIALGIRAVGRASNPEYWNMLKLLRKHYEHPESMEALQELLVYDIDVCHVKAIETKGRTDLWYPDPPQGAHPYGPTSLISHFCITFFGRKMIYPGSITSLNALLESTNHGLRREMWRPNDSFRAVRYPLKTSDGNIIDAVLLRQKGNNDRQKNVCVIVCDGNAAIYERFMSRTFIDAGFNVIVWNPPGFGQSTGVPYPSAVYNSASAVYSLASDIVGFRDIMVYGWSIGGLPATWLAANYPVQSLFIDASFDDLIPLAKGAMPSAMEPIVKHAVGSYFNMPISEQLSRYSGKVMIFRRRFDEIMCTDRSNMNAQIASNRGNYLLRDFLKNRYSFFKWTDADDEILFEYINASSDQRKYLELADESILSTNLQHLSFLERELVIRRLANYHFRDFDIGHNMPLPSSAKFEIEDVPLSDDILSSKSSSDQDEESFYKVEA